MNDIEKNDSQNFPVPFTNMAISLSGGGYRATTFHLGALSYLNERKYKSISLLENVKILSTISGGTLTGVMYALKLSKGGTFKDCFDKLYELLSEDKLVDEALHKLNNPGKWTNKYKTRDVINSFAEVYNEKFYDGATFEQLYTSSPGHLTDVIFGSSEFTDAQQFRFQTQGRFGSGDLNISMPGAEKIRLADAAAASSCFPGGFEPMIMPQDFGNGPDSEVVKNWKQKSSDKSYPITALMDGGVLDNQGIEPVEHAERRNGSKENPYIGTYIISDVSSKKIDPYEVPKFEHNSFKDIFTINRLNLIFGIISVFIIGMFFMQPAELCIILGASLLTIFGIWFLLYFLFRKAFRKASLGAFGEDMVTEIMKDFGVIDKTPIYILLFLIEFRLSSVMEMTTSIFMRRIRELQLGFLYQSPKWNYRIKANNMYSLYENKKIVLSPEMDKAVKATNTMSTTLWFSEKDKQDNVLDDLIACGQFTLCYNLKKYVDELQTGKLYEDIWKSLKQSEKDDIIELGFAINEDWKKFFNDPYWLLAKDTGMERLKG